MAALGVHGDPEGWQDTANAVGAIVSPLQDEVETADALGGSGLAEHWAGPVADKYQEAWQQRYQRYRNLIDLAARTPEPIANFGARLAGYQQRAQQLESHYTGHGLHLTLDGTSFTLPINHISLPQELQRFLEGLLIEAKGAVEELWRDIEGAAGDLEGALKPLAGDLGDLAFALSPYGIYWVGKVTLDYLNDEMKHDPLGALSHLVLEPIHDLAHDTVEAADKLVEDDDNVFAFDARNLRKLEDVADFIKNDSSGYFDSLRGDVEQGASDVAKVSGIDGVDTVKLLGRGALVAAIGITAVQTIADSKHGWVNSLEENAGGWTGLGVGLVAAALLGPGLGAVAIGAVVSIGVSAIVQHEVNAHRAGTTQALNGIGHFVRNQFDPVAD
jgi:uncharacterized protein YukE